MSTVTGPASAKMFKCVKPEFAAGKRVITLARTDRLWAGIQYVKEGGENNLHSHSHMDGIYFVIKGRAKFYGEGDVVIGDVGPNEGMLITRGYRYWFESTGEDALELLLVDAFDMQMSDPATVDGDRIDHQAPKAVQLSGTHVVEDATAR